MLLHALEHLDEPADVGVIERSVDLVEQAEGLGRYRKIANISAIAVSAFSPPDSSCTLWRRLPGGWAMMSMPLSSASLSSSSIRPARAAAEERRERLLEVLVDHGERVVEALARGFVDLA